MLSNVITVALRGIEPFLIGVETDIARGLPAMNIVGLGDTTVKEASDRIRTAIQNAALEYPKSRITINLSPAWLRKKGSHLDLPMAIGILASSGQLAPDWLGDSCFIGELSLDGHLHPCQGILPMVRTLAEEGIRRVFVPVANREEAALVQNMEVYGVTTLKEVVDMLNGGVAIPRTPPQTPWAAPGQRDGRVASDFAEVKGQEFAKRAILIAVSGGHGILMTGSPGTGKSMLSARIPDLMPPLMPEESLELTAIYSAAGQLEEGQSWISRRPFRTPGTGITRTGLLGGHYPMKPGEVTLAHRGVLFLDEMGEFDRTTLDALRVPMETGMVSLTRKGETCIFPANFLLVGATNPCKCGYFGHPTRSCSCRRSDVLHYQNKLSGPVKDRIDMHIQLLPVDYASLQQTDSMTTAEMQQKIGLARQRQRERYQGMGIQLNSQLSDGMLGRFCSLDPESNRLLEQAYERMALSPRTMVKVLKLARTIADVEGADQIALSHLTEALQYREKRMQE